jgi:hypothetical protein
VDFELRTHPLPRGGTDCFQVDTSPLRFGFAYRCPETPLDSSQDEIAESITKSANKIGSRTFSELSYKFLRTSGILE